MKVKRESEVAQSFLTLSDPMDRSLPGSSVHGIFQARVLEWGAIAFSHVTCGNARDRCITGVTLHLQLLSAVSLGLHVSVRALFHLLSSYTGVFAY